MEYVHCTLVHFYVDDVSIQSEEERWEGGAVYLDTVQYYIIFSLYLRYIHHMQEWINKFIQSIYIYVVPFLECTLLQCCAVYRCCLDVFSRTYTFWKSLLYISCHVFFFWFQVYKQVHSRKMWWLVSCTLCMYARSKYQYYIA